MIAEVGIKRFFNNADDAFENVGQIADNILKELDINVPNKSSVIDNLAKQLQFEPNDLVYGPSAMGELRKLQQQAGGKLLNDIPKPMNKTFIEHSVNTMERVLSKGNNIHFDLTNMNDIENILNNRGDFADTITSQEIRYLRNNWNRFQGNVKFYRNGEGVNAPWNK